MKTVADSSQLIFFLINLMISYTITLDDSVYLYTMFMISDKQHTKQFSDKKWKQVPALYVYMTDDT